MDMTPEERARRVCKEHESRGITAINMEWHIALAIQDAEQVAEAAGYRWGVRSAINEAEMWNPPVGSYIENVRIVERATQRAITKNIRALMDKEG